MNTDPMDAFSNPETDDDLCPFQGNTILALAASGQLVLEVDHADMLIAEMTAALEVVRTRCRINALLRGHVRQWLTTSGSEDEQALFDTTFAEQIAPGRLDQAAIELPKYIRAFEMAKVPRVGDHGAPGDRNSIG